MKEKPLRAISLLGAFGVVPLLCGFALLLFLRPLPARSSPLIIMVTSTAHHGPGTLRDALWQAIPGTTISFSPDVFPSHAPATIAVTESLQFWTNGVTVDASNAGVTLDGSQAGPAINGFEFFYDECVLRGLTIRGFPGNGIQVGAGAERNTIGGSRSIGSGPNGEGNLILLSGLDGIKIQGDANQAQGNIIGVDPGGRSDAGNRANGVSLTNGASGNVIGGAASGQGNIISGNGQHGVYIGGSGTASNSIIGNAIGTSIDGLSGKGNGSTGVFIALGAQDNRIGGAAAGAGNTIAYNQGVGVAVNYCGGNRVTRNAIHSNGGMGIRHESLCLTAPSLRAAAVGADEMVTGSAAPGAAVDVFSDDEDEGRSYAGSTTADAQGHFRFTATGGFRYANVTATATDDAGNTSEFSAPVHLAWTVLLYVNGDNDLQDAFLAMFDGLVAAGPSPQANVLVLVDGYQGPRSGTALYDITRGPAAALSAPVTLTGELNMGAGQTLVDFVTWGRSYAPTRHTLLAIIDHGGGWAATSTEVPGALPVRIKDFLGGNSGLSWDFTNGHDYLDSNKVRRALSSITDNGAAKLDVVFYDVCLMGMLEVAYQIKDYADYFVSSQNIGWAPEGQGGRYVQAVRGIGAATTPEEVAQLLVAVYDASFPEEGLPFTASAVKMAALSNAKDAMNDLALAIMNSPVLPAGALHQAYAAAQKLDYDTDFRLEPETDGMVDLYDFAARVATTFTRPEVVAAAQRLMTELDRTIVANRKASGPAWIAGNASWDLERVHGLSVYLPLGEDLILPIPITETPLAAPGVVQIRYLHQRELYVCAQLQFACDTHWDELIAAYYAASSVPGFVRPENTPLEGLQDPRPRPGTSKRLWLPLIMRGS